MNIKQFLPLFLVASCTAAFGGKVSVTNVRQDVVDSSLQVSVSGMVAMGKTTYLFDGIPYQSGTSPDNRWLANLANNQKRVYVQVSLPAEYRAGSRIVLTKYRLFRIPFWHTSGRAPVAWKVYGVPEGVGTADETGCVELDSRTNVTWPGSDSAAAPAGETNEFAVAVQAPVGFRAFRFVFTESGITAAGKSNTYDLGLYEIELDADAYDEPVATVDDGLDGVVFNSRGGEFQPKDGRSLAKEGTVTAPKYVQLGSETYECRGHRIEMRSAAEGGVWTTKEEIEDGKSSFDYTFPESAENVERIVWLWTVLPVSEDFGPVRLADLLKYHGCNLSTCVSSVNYYEQKVGPFDGLRFFSSWNRWLGNMNAEGGTFFSVAVPEGFHCPGESMYVANYRIYSLNQGSRERTRAPTAWTVQLKESEGEWAVIDSRTDCSWDDVQVYTEDANFLEFTPSVSGVPFDQLKFIPTASTETENQWNVGLNELDVRVYFRNPLGTVRVLADGSGLDVAGAAFEPAVDTVTDPATGALTFKAPSVVMSTSGTERFSCTGYVIETFNEESFTWEKASSGESREVSFTPEATKSYRVKWTISKTPQVKISIDVKSGIGDGVSVSPTSESGFYESGTELTLTAIAADDDLTAAGTDGDRYRSRFVRWEGDLEGLDVDATSPLIKFPIDCGRNVKPVFAHEWFVYQPDPGEGNPWRMKNGFFEFAVSLYNSDVYVAEYCSGQGDLDWDQPAYRAGQSSPLSITSTAAHLLNAQNKPEWQNIITSVRFPRTLNSLGAWSMRNMHSMTNTILISDVLTDVPNNVFTRNVKSDVVVVKVPSVTQIGQYVFFNNPMSETDFSEWDLSSVATVGSWAFKQEGSLDVRYHRIAGTLALPKALAISSEAFMNFKALGGIELGTARGSLASIGENAFAQTVLTNLVIGSSTALTVAATAFANTTDSCGMLTVRFLGNAPDDRGAVDNILLCNDASEGRIAKLHVSSARPKWAAYVTDLADVDVSAPGGEAIVAAATEAGAAGVWRSADGKYKAIVFFEPMPLDPKGAVLILR